MLRLLSTTNIVVHTDRQVVHPSINSLDYSIPLYCTNESLLNFLLRRASCPPQLTQKDSTCRPRLLLTVNCLLFTITGQNPEHLLLFSVGNDGNLSDSGCTVGSPAIAKNVLTVGSSSSGQTRWTSTREDGEPVEALDDPMSDIDTVSYFSSQGPTEDGRIKPEIVAPGDQVRQCFKSWCSGQGNVGCVK